MMYRIWSLLLFIFMIIKDQSAWNKYEMIFGFNISFGIIVDSLAFQSLRRIIENIIKMFGYKNSFFQALVLSCVCVAVSC